MRGRFDFEMWKSAIWFPSFEPLAVLEAEGPLVL